MGIFRVAVASALAVGAMAGCGGSSSETDADASTSDPRAAEADIEETWEYDDAAEARCADFVDRYTHCSVRDSQVTFVVVDGDGYRWAGVGAVTCKELDEPAFRDSFVRAAAAQIKEDYGSEGYYRESFVADGVASDTDVMCDRSPNRNYTPYDDIEDSVTSAMEQIG